jgi:mannose/fructose/N-acetylgalactosamine-specific phosphotransferase system component IID
MSYSLSGVHGICYVIVVTPHPCLGVTIGDHVSWNSMENMILTIMMISMSMDGNSSTPLLTFTTTGQPRLIMLEHIPNLH